MVNRQRRTAEELLRDMGREAQDPLASRPASGRPDEGRLPGCAQ